MPVAHKTQPKDSADCLPICVAMILDYLKQPKRLRSIKRILETSAFGTPASNIQKLNSAKLNATYQQGSLVAIEENLRSGNPCIVFITTDELSYWQVATSHAFVVVGIDDQFIYANDPYFDTAPIAIPLGEFMLGWIERDQYFGVIRSR